MSVKLIRPRRFGDERGWFMETYNAERYAAAGVDVSFVQDNHSMSRDAGVLRGLHWQAPPYGQAKLLRCVRGRIWDVAVDARRGSPTFGKWVAAELSAENGHQLFIPVGFAHGFVTLEPDTEVQYKASVAYSPAQDRAIRFDDPDLSIAWPLDPAAYLISEKDRAAPTLASKETGF